MREIKYRLRIGNKIVGYEKWYAGKSETEFDKTSAKAQWLYSTDGEYWNPEYIYHTHKDCFTGLKDKHRREIFEGDRLLFTTRGGMQMEYVVKWNKKGFGPARMSSHNQHEMEIVGNIYEESAELLDKLSKDV